MHIFIIGKDQKSKKGQNIIIIMLFPISKILINPDYIIQWLLHGSIAQRDVFKKVRFVTDQGVQILWPQYSKPPSILNPIIEGVQNITAGIY